MTQNRLCEGVVLVIVTDHYRTQDIKMKVNRLSATKVINTK